MLLGAVMDAAKYYLVLLGCKLLLPTERIPRGNRSYLA